MLLDVTVPRKLAAVLGEFGIEAHTAESRGWDDLTNGALVEAAANAGFTAVLTRDRLFGQSASRALRRFPHVGVVLVTLPQLRGPEFLEAFRQAWEHSPVGPVFGTVTYWPAR